MQGRKQEVCAGVTTPTNFKVQSVQAVAMGWHEVANVTPGQRDTIFSPPLIIFFPIFCCFIFVAKKTFPNMLVGIKVGLSNTLETSIFSCTNFVH